MGLARCISVAPQNSNFRGCSVCHCSGCFDACKCQIETLTLMPTSWDISLGGYAKVLIEKVELHHMHYLEAAALYDTKYSAVCDTEYWRLQFLQDMSGFPKMGTFVPFIVARIHLYSHRQPQFFLIDRRNKLSLEHFREHELKLALHSL